MLLDAVAGRALREINALPAGGIDADPDLSDSERAARILGRHTPTQPAFNWDARTVTARETSGPFMEFVPSLGEPIRAEHGIEATARVPFTGDARLAIARPSRRELGWYAGDATVVGQTGGGSLAITFRAQHLHADRIEHGMTELREHVETHATFAAAQIEEWRAHVIPQLADALSDRRARLANLTELHP